MEIYNSVMLDTYSVVDICGYIILFVIVNLTSNIKPNIL